MEGVKEKTVEEEAGSGSETENRKMESSQQSKLELMVVQVAFWGSGARKEYLFASTDVLYFVNKACITKTPLSQSMAICNLGINYTSLS